MQYISPSSIIWKSGQMQLLVYFKIFNFKAIDVSSFQCNMVMRYCRPLNFDEVFKPSPGNRLVIVIEKKGYNGSSCLVPLETLISKKPLRK